MSIVLAVVGAAVVLRTWMSVIKALVVPRRSRDRVSRAVTHAVDRSYRLATRRITSYARRDRMLATQAPAAILTQLVVWLVLFYLGFAMLLGALDRQGPAHALAQAGSSLLTLGYAGPSDGPLTVVDYLAAATGLVVVALQIGYLPTLYSAFNRRETEVTLLASRAGTPPWGPEVLARTRFGFGAEDDGAVMDEFYLQWERWAADVSESHTNYPVLIRFRSPAKYSSWLVALVAVMDSAALWLALSPSRAPAPAARLALRMGFMALRSIAETVGLEPDHDPDPDGPLQLSYAEYLQGVERITSTSFPLERTPEEAWPDFRGWRVNYEPVAYALAEILDAVPGPWTGPRRTTDPPMAPLRPANRKPTRTRAAEGRPASLSTLRARSSVWPHRCGGLNPQSGATMLNESKVEANIPASDLDRARDFYADKLGLTPSQEFGDEALAYRTAGGTAFNVYRTEYAGQAGHTIAQWHVSDLDSEVRDLKAKGVTFEVYDMPGVEWDGEIASVPGMGRAAWFKDSEGNTMCLDQASA